MPSKYATTSDVGCEENIMTSRVRHSERASVISDCLVLHVYDVPQSVVTVNLILSRRYDKHVCG